MLDALDQCFPRVPAAFKGVSRALLAVAVYHFEHLNQALPETHRLRSNPFFTKNWGSRLGQFVVAGCNLDPSISGVRGTGIPPATLQLAKVEGIARSVLETNELLRTLPQNICVELKDTLEANASAAGVITPAAVVGLLDAKLRDQETTLRGHFERYFGNTSELLAAQPPPSQSGRVTRLETRFKWGGGYHQLPFDFKIPKVNVLTAFQLWHCGSQAPVSGHVALKTVIPCDFSLTAERKRFCELKFIMNHVHQLTIAESEEWAMLHENEEDAVEFSLEQVSSVFALVANKFVDQQTSKGRERRVNELDWVSAASEVRKQLRKRARMTQETREE